MNTIRSVSIHEPAWFLASAVLLLVFPSTAVPGDSKTEDRSSLLQTTTLLQAPSGAKMEAQSLRGKVVVLEFWATWCGPCIAAIPHLNALADKFKNEPVQFIAITTEDADTVKRFLAKREIRAWIALDGDKALNRAYGVGEIPHTVILDKDGKVAGTTQPTMDLERHIEDLLAGKKIGFSRTYPALDREKVSRGAFGPVIERTLRIDGKECDFLVLRTGKVLRHSCVDGEVSLAKPPTPFMQWVMENGVDVGFLASTNDYGHGYLGLVVLQAASYQFPYDPVPLERIPSFVSVAELQAYNAHHPRAENPLIGALVGVTNIWNDLMADQLLGPPDGEPASFLKEKGLRLYPPSTNAMPPIAFATHDGIRGLLEVTGFTANPPSLKLRYKLVQQRK